MNCVMLLRTRLAITKKFNQSDSHKSLKLIAFLLEVFTTLILFTGPTPFTFNINKSF